MTSVDPALSAQPFVSRRQNWVNQIRRHAHLQPQNIALRFRGHTTSWGELDRRVTRLAAALASRGVTSGDRVMVLMVNRVEFVESVIATNMLGAILAPVNFRMTPAEVAGLISDCQPRVIITEAALVSVAEAATALQPVETIVSMGNSRSPTSLDYETLLIETDTMPPQIDIPNDSPALILYTSGTTGRPKGAVLTHTNLAGQAMNSLLSYGVDLENDVSFVGVPLFHVAALAVLAQCLLLGQPAVIHPVGAFDADKLLDVVEAERVTSLFLVPAQWQLVCDAQRANPRRLQLRVMSWGAAPASKRLLEEMYRTFPDVAVLAGFGQTEMSPLTCILSGHDAQGKVGSVGKVIPTVDARVVDSDMNDVKLGDVGEIVYRAPTLMQGYWNDPGATAEAFAGGWFHSGDLVRQDDDGYLWVVDRKKDMIISGGENIYSVEVENALAAHPAITEVAVIGRSHHKWGEVPIAVVALRESELTLDDITEFLNDRLARYKHPKGLEIVESLPRNPSGKILKAELRKLFAQTATSANAAGGS